MSSENLRRNETLSCPILFLVVKEKKNNLKERVMNLIHVLTILAICSYVTSTQLFMVTTIAGSGTISFGGDNGPATAGMISAPWGLAEDTAGNIYIGDQSNNRVRMVSSLTGMITTYAGTGTGTYNGDNIPASTANIYFPMGLWISSTNIMYVADRANYRIRTIDLSTSIIKTFAGTSSGGYSGDGGPATSATLSEPYNGMYHQTFTSLIRATIVCEW